MLSGILTALGGLGLFLLGMLVLTDGLRQLAGGALRRVLAHYTRSPLSGALAGAATTAVIQSSSATTVTTVGFVGAGLLSFPHALGIILGANIGTTMTGWLVAILGFKLPLGTLVLPLLLIGVLLRLFGRGRARAIGWAMAGFSLLFMGISAMQLGMAPFEGVVTPESFPDDSLLGRLQMVLIGVAITVITQSSSAGVAAALVALGAGAISFPQAAALVIGMDVGTTVTAVLATIGGGTATKQTGYAHVIYNLFTASVAFFLLIPFAALVTALDQRGIADAQIALVLFHTAFNCVGMALILPLAHPFARMIVWLIPERGPPLQARLDNRLLRDPAAAVDAAAATVRDIASTLFDVLASLLEPQQRRKLDDEKLNAVRDAIEGTRSFLEEVRSDPRQVHVYRRHLAAMHALDHLGRLYFRCNQTARVDALDSESRLRRLAGLLRSAVSAAPEDRLNAEVSFDRLQALLQRQRRSYRDRIVAQAAEQRIDAEAALGRLDAVRWLQRVAYHLWRIQHHLNRAESERPFASSQAEPHEEAEED